MQKVEKVLKIPDKVIGIPRCIFDPKAGRLAVLVSCTKTGNSMHLKFDPKKKISIYEGPIEVGEIPQHLTTYTNPKNWELVDSNVLGNGSLVLEYRNFEEKELRESSLWGFIRGGSKE